MDKKINLRDLFAKTFGAEKLDVGAGLGIIVGAGLGIIVGAGLGTQFKYPPIMEQQNPPIPPPKGNRLIRNWTTQPTLFSTAIAVKDWGRAGFV
ncbi:MAG: hypothetical protein RIG63_04645 [Coleofasciculus chthonoplastes F3-SA18-01]|uniref:hypothetical protein n=1 Tax=Coleofasciculus chthonoplastes TaxID=64178 RepID=UPI0033044C3C